MAESPATQTTEREFSWTTHTHEHRERSNDWYWALGTVAVVSAGLALFFGNVLFAIIIMVAAGSIGVLAARGPREHLVKIDKRGIAIDGTLYPYSSIHSFWVEKEVSEPRFFLATTSLLSSHFSFYLPESVRAEELEQYLKKFITEEEQGPHIGEHFAELFGL